MIETMTAYENYEYNMALIEDLFRHIALQVFGRTVFTVRGHSVDFGTPWTRLRMTDAVLAETGIDFDAAHDHAALSAVLAERALPGGPTIGDALVAVFEAVVAPKLIQPTLIYGHPVEISPLAKSMDSDPRYAERFEIFIGGMECGDNWSEQNDPVKLLERWRSQLPSETEKRRDLEYQPLDYDFIETLEYGIAPTTGIGPGIERMAMIFTEQENIDDVIFFPIMRPVISQANRAIYGIPGGPGEVGDTSGQE
jgi:lysyl-tRNA synthetase class 2